MRTPKDALAEAALKAQIEELTERCERQQDRLQELNRELDAMREIYPDCRTANDHYRIFARKILDASRNPPERVKKFVERALDWLEDRRRERSEMEEELRLGKEALAKLRQPQQQKGE